MNRMSMIVVVAAVVLAVAGCGKPSVTEAASTPAAREQKTAAAVYVCPMGDYSGPMTKDGRCPKCGMQLKKQ